MQFKTILAFVALTSAVPLLQQRDDNVKTVTTWAFETIYQYTTVYPGQANQPTPLAAAPAVAVQSSAKILAAARPVTAVQGSPQHIPTQKPQPTLKGNVVAEPPPIETPPPVIPEPSSTIIPDPAPEAPEAPTLPIDQPATFSATGSGKYTVALLPGATTPNGPCTEDHLCSGDITHFNPSMGAGSCGPKDWATNSIWQDSDDVVAISSKIMGSFSNGGVAGSENIMCKRSVRIKAQQGGQDVTARVVDKCPTCPGSFDLDLSPAVFAKVAPNGNGRVSNVQWYWV